MHKTKILFLSCALTLSLVGCAVTASSDSNAESNTPTLVVTNGETKMSTAAPIVVQVEDFLPAEKDVLSARKRALEGMTSDQIERLNTVIREANLWWEQAYFYNNIFEKLSNPSNLYWNYFDQTGEIQIGWAFSGDLDMSAICEQECITEDEFYAKYGTEVVSDNKYTADDFVAILDELIATVQSEDLKTDLQYVRDEAWLAKENHSMEHANNEYKALHDLDYFLLRYGPADVGPYVDDDSTVSKYYGTLSIYS